jgi:hypothetical protein
MRIEMANDAVKRLKLAFTGVTNEVAIQLAPSIRRLADDLAPFLSNASSSIGESSTRLGKIGATVALISDYITGIRIVFNAIELSVAKVAAVLANVGGFMLKGILQPLRLIPGVGDKIIGKINDAIELTEEYGRVSEENLRGLLEQKSAYDSILHEQNQIRAQVEREQKAREATARAMREQADQAKKIVELNREADPLIRAMMFANGLAPVVDGPPRDFAPAPAPAAPWSGAFFGPERPEAPRAGGFRVVDSLANLATGGYSNTTGDPIEEMKTGVFRFFDYLKNGELNVTLAGVEL